MRRQASGWLRSNSNPDAVDHTARGVGERRFESRRLKTQAGTKGRGIEPYHELLLPLAGGRDVPGEGFRKSGLNQVAKFDRRAGAVRKMAQTGCRAVNQVTDSACFVHCDQARIEKQVGRKIIVLRGCLGHSLAHCTKANSPKGDGAKLPVYGVSYDSGVASLKQESRRLCIARPVVVSRIEAVVDHRHGAAGSRYLERAA